MSKVFKIARGIWDIPGIGKVDSRQEISDEKLFKIYKLRRRVFPWISLGPNAEAFLKKQKLTAKEVAALVQNAQTVEETELLAGLSETKAVAGIVDTHLAALKSNQPK